VIGQLVLLPPHTVIRLPDRHCAIPKRYSLYAKAVRRASKLQEMFDQPTASKFCCDINNNFVLLLPNATKVM
jgi:hypothetical protein